jgi:isoleucyl-tRNA synthetase
LREECKNYALGWIDEQRKDFKRLGVLGDWENPYITLKPAYEAKQIKVFGEMAKKGYIYKGKRLSTGVLIVKQHWLRLKLNMAKKSHMLFC